MLINLEKQLAPKKVKNTDLKILTEIFHGQIIEKVLKLVYMGLY
jgi:hypothetical protein